MNPSDVDHDSGHDDRTGLLDCNRLPSPRIPMTLNTMMRAADRCRHTADTASAARAMMPPSPSLSARITISTYFTKTMSVRV